MYSSEYMAVPFLMSLFGFRYKRNDNGAGTGMRTDDTAKLSDRHEIGMTFKDRLAVVPVFLNRAVVDITGISHDNGHREIDTAAGKDAVIHHLMALTDTARFTDRFKRTFPIQRKNGLDMQNTANYSACFGDSAAAL